MCPPVPPPAMHANDVGSMRAPAAAIAGAAWRGDAAAASAPSARQSRRRSDEPPKEMNGRGSPVMGSRPITPPMLTKRLADEPGGDAGGEQACRSGPGAGSAMRTPRRPSATKRRDQRAARRTGRARRPMMAKMKSVWALGRKPHFARLRAEAGAEQAARARCDLRLDRLVAGVLRVLPRVEEGRAAGRGGRARPKGPATRRRRPAADHRRAARPARRPRRAPTNTIAAEHDRRAQVGLAASAARRRRRTPRAPGEA